MELLLALYILQNNENYEGKQELEIKIEEMHTSLDMAEAKVDRLIKLYSAENK